MTNLSGATPSVFAITVTTAFRGKERLLRSADLQPLLPHTNPLLSCLHERTCLRLKTEAMER